MQTKCDTKIYNLQPAAFDIYLKVNKKIQPFMSDNTYLKLVLLQYLTVHPHNKIEKKVHVVQKVFLLYVKSANVLLWKLGIFLLISFNVDDGCPKEDHNVIEKLSVFFSITS